MPPHLLTPFLSLAVFVRNFVSAMTDVANRNLTTRKALWENVEAGVVPILSLFLRQLLSGSALGSASCSLPSPEERLLQFSLVLL